MSILSTRERDFNAIQISPEILKNEKNNEKSDVHSYSMIVYEIMTNEIPFKNIDNKVDLYNKVVKNKSRPIIKESIPYIYRYFMEICWSDEPEKRPSFDIIVSNLEKNREFITAEINSKEYFNYVKYVSKNIDK
ncbi:hypothetical protein M9Y10_003523 [Tritrichomonas musculus]|uniref:Protein kinase domain-containing protein n=1 Tax=Tritrichomonas musculus TaxID=1915356 RepID=A0ABR2JPL1_9EUKA